MNACADRAPVTASRPADQLVIGVSEGNLESSEFGIGHIVNLVTVEALTQSGVDGRALPRLAAGWTWENDDRTLRLKLRDDVILHDGRRFDSQLAAEALAIAVARGANRAVYPAFRDLTAAIPDGPLELRLEVSQRSSMLPEELTVPLDIPAGPYRVVARSSEEVALEQFEQYYLGTPAIRRVVLRTYDTLRTTWASLLRGDLDLVYDVPAEAIELIRSEEVQVVPFKRWYQYVMAFNSRRGPLQSPQVRLALNMAVDRGVLVSEVLRGAGTPSSGPLWPEYWAADRSIAQYAFDPIQAGEILDQAGFPLKSSGGDAAAARFRITCLIPENFAVLERIALYVQKNLFKVGVDLQFNVAPLEDFGRLIGAGEFDAVLLDVISGPTPGRPYLFWASAKRLRGAYNMFGYENAEAEDLFSTLRTTRNEAALRSATRRLQRVFLDDPPALFLAWNERARAIRREFDFPVQPAIDPVFSLWQWKRRTDMLAASVP